MFDMTGYITTASGLSIPSRQLTAEESHLQSLSWSNTSTRQKASLYADRYRATPPTDYLSALPGESPDDWSLRRKHATGRIEFHLKARCLLYIFNKGPKRTLEFSEDAGDKRAFWDALMGNTVPRNPDDERPKYNAFWAKAQMETLYHGVILVKSHYIEDEPPLPLIFRPWQFDVVVDKRDRRKFTAVKVLLNATDEEVTSGSIQGYGHYYEVWTTTDFYLVDDAWQILDHKPNPYGRLPFIRIPSDPLWYSFFPTAYYDELVPACRALGDLDTEELDLAYNLYGQPVVKGDIDDKDKKRIIGKNSPQYCSSGGDYTRVSPNADIEGFLSVKQDLVLSFALAKGISPAIADWKTYAARDQSSLAVRAAQYGPLESRDQDAEIWQRHEERLAALHAWVQGVHIKGGDTTYYLPSAYHVEFPSVSDTVISEQDKIAGQTMEIANNLKPRWVVAKERNPELTDDQARARVAEATAEAADTASQNNSGANDNATR